MGRRDGVGMDRVGRRETLLHLLGEVFETLLHNLLCVMGM